MLLWSLCSPVGGAFAPDGFRRAGSEVHGPRRAGQALRRARGERRCAYLHDDERRLEDPPRDLVSVGPSYGLCSLPARRWRVDADDRRAATGARVHQARLDPRGLRRERPRRLPRKERRAVRQARVPRRVRRAAEGQGRPLRRARRGRAGRARPALVIAGHSGGAVAAMATDRIIETCERRNASRPRSTCRRGSRRSRRRSPAASAAAAAALPRVVGPRAAAAAAARP